MNRYTVVYLADADDELVALWGDASDRTQISDAANHADRILASAPHSQSVYLGEQLWRLEIVPLRFYFAIREEDRLVEVSNVIRLTK